MPDDLSLNLNAELGPVLVALGQNGKKQNAREKYLPKRIRNNISDFNDMRENEPSGGAINKSKRVASNRVIVISVCLSQYTTSNKLSYNTLYEQLLELQKTYLEPTDYVLFNVGAPNG